jgi:hypothetical protein
MISVIAAIISICPCCIRGTRERFIWYWIKFTTKCFGVIKVINDTIEVWNKFFIGNEYNKRLVVKHGRSHDIVT